MIPYWRGRSLRDRMMPLLPSEWHAAYEAGVFTEFMEQRAPGHTVLDDKIYGKGMLGFKADIARALAALDYEQTRRRSTAASNSPPWTSPATR